MKPNYKDKCVTVHDNGLFVELAVLLSHHFGKVNYYSPWESAFPKSNSLLVGKGIPGVNRIDNFQTVVEETDLFVFPDVYFADLQLELESKGKRVWGSRKGEELELYRNQSKKYMRKVGVEIGDYYVVTGLVNLRKYLKENENQWVKVSRTRGDMESFHSKNYKLIEPRLDELEHSLGAKKKVMEFIVEESIDDAVEIAYDGYCIDGVFPKKGQWGIEIKDKAYMGVFSNYDDMPEQILDVNEQLSGALRKYRYKNMISPEMRIRMKDKIPLVIDPAMRFGSPPSELQMLMWTNLPDILWHGAEGDCVDPIPAGKYGVELLIHSAWADKNWQAVQFPEELRENVKLRNLTMIDGEYYVVPQSIGLPEIGAVVAVGNTLDEAMEKVKGYAEKVEGYFLDVFPDALDGGQEEIKKLNSIGIRI